MSDVKKEYGFDDETNWKEVLSNPSRWFGLYYLLLLFGIIAAGLTYLNNMNDIYKAEIENSVLLVYEEDEEEKNNEFLIENKYEENIKAGNAQIDKLIDKVDNLNKDMSSEGMLLRKVTDNLETVIITLNNDKRWQSNYEVFYGLVSHNVPHNGFNSDFTELTKDQILSIHSLLVSQFYNDNSAQESSI
jgi:hypothetical protein